MAARASLILCFAILSACGSSLLAGEGTRVVYENRFEIDNVPFSDEYDLRVFGWFQDHGRLDLPMLMRAEAAVPGTAGADGRVLRIPAAGGKALLTSLRNLSRYAVGTAPRDMRHLPVMAGERMSIEMAMRWDSLGPGSFFVGIRFALSERDGQEVFASGLGRDLIPLFRGEGGGRAWHPVQAEVIVPDGAVGWRLEIHVDASRERRPGSIEVDNFRVIASPRLVMRWDDPLRRVSVSDLQPVQVISVGLPTGDYSLDLAVIDDRGEVFAAEQIIRYVDPEHPILLQPEGRFLAKAPTGGRGTLSPAGIRYLVVNLKGSDGESVLFREVPFLTGDAPYVAGRGQSRHGLVVPLPIPDWVGPIAPFPALLEVDREVREWPEELASVPEVRRAALLRVSGGDPAETAEASKPLWGAIPRWYLDPAPEITFIRDLADRARDLRIGVTGEGVGDDHGAVPRLRTVTADWLREHRGELRSKNRFAARMIGETFGSDPESWIRALFSLDAMGATDVFLADPHRSLFRAPSAIGEGYAPLPTLLAWQFARGYLGSAQWVGQEPWRSDAEAHLYRRGRTDAVVLLARGDQFDSEPLTLQVSGAVRIFDALGRTLPVGPVEDGRVTIEPRGRFLLIEGVDLPLERTVRSLVLASEEDGFSLTADHRFSSRVTLEPRLEFPPGYIVQAPPAATAVEVGEPANWRLAVTPPPSAGLSGVEWLSGTLIVRRENGETDRVPFRRPIPLECSRVEIEPLATIERDGVLEVGVRLTNRESAPVRFHLYLQASPTGWGDQTLPEERLAVGESREYRLTLSAPTRRLAAASSLWVGLAFLDGDRGYCNRTVDLP